MKKRLTIMVATFAALLLTTATARADDNKPSAFAKRTQKEIMAYMRDAGYAPQIDPDGDILFTYQELKCYIIIRDGDGKELFVKTFLTFGKPEEMSEDEELCLHAAINKANKEYRMVKCYYTDERVVFVVDSWIQSTSDYTNFFKLYMRGLQHAVNEVMYWDE